MGGGPLGSALNDGRIDPFPYREDVSVGLYLAELAQQGQVRVVPRQRKDAMPLDFPQYCAEGGRGPLWVLHRFQPATASCLWAQVEAQRASQEASAAFCNCVAGSQIAAGT